ncbi:MAG: gamma carbonic anhydrase family protein [Bacteriovoracaceae bacterium]|nr:gamma carbonic anhydrase family protein [Bacteriovoracaceae bacterium]
MPIHPYLNYKHEFGVGVYIAPGVQIVGRAIFGDHVSIWHNSVVRADVNFIRIGENTNVQDLSMLHVTERNSLTIGKNVSIGHSVVMHGCTVGDSCLIGMGAIILDGAVIGENCVVAAGTVVPPGKTYPPGSMIMGNPAKLTRPLTEEERVGYGNHYKSYVGYKDQYLKQASS